MKTTLLLLTLAGLTVAAGPMLSGNPLANLPGAPGSHLSAINALGDNAWLNLGAPGPDSAMVRQGLEGRARGRSWGGSGLVLCPELRGAMYTGEGVHAYVKSDGFGMDDWWFYDINANRWICVWPGTDTRNFNAQVQNGDIKADSLGRAVDASGQPVPGHIMIHVYHWLTYDPDLKKFLLFPSWSPFGKYFMPGLTSVEAGIDALNAQGMNKSGPVFGPWTYDVQTGKFARDLSANACPVYGNGNFPFFQYSGADKQCFLADASGSAFFNPSTRAWGAGLPAGGLSSYDFSGCYDSRRNRVYVGNGSDNFYCCDLGTKAWTKVSFPVSTSFSTNSGAITYDSIADRVLVFNFTGNNSIFPLNPATNAFEAALPFGSAFASGRRPQNSVCYDPALGVHFIYSGTDSYDDVSMWVYKYKRAVVAAEMEAASSGCGIAAQPNPFRSEVAFRFHDRGDLRIFTVNGKKVADFRNVHGDRVVWNAGMRPAGVYLAEFKAPGNTSMTRLLLVK